MRPRERRAADCSAGYTLIEVLVALTIGAFVIGVLLQMVIGQGRYVEGQSAREEVQQNSRVTLELIGSELRGLPSGGALVRADADSLTIRSPRVWGSICDVSGSATLDVAFPSVPGMSFTVNTGTGAMVNLGRPTAPVWSSAVTVTSIGPPTDSCGGVTLSAGIEGRRVVLAGPAEAEGVGPSVGNVIYLYDLLTYQTGVSEVVRGRWIQRRIGSGPTASKQPMIGPVSDTEGLHFRYYADASDAPLGTPISEESVRNSVSRIQMTVRTVARNGRGDERASKTDTIFISLRNRQF